MNKGIRGIALLLIVLCTGMDSPRRKQGELVKIDGKPIIAGKNKANFKIALARSQRKEEEKRLKHNAWDDLGTRYTSVAASCGQSPHRATDEKSPRQ